MLFNILEQTLIFFPLICALYMSYVILRVTDVSVDATMVLGAAVSSKLLLGGCNPALTTVAALLCGFIAGVLVALVQYRNSVNDIIAGLLMSFILYSINLNVMGKPHLMIMNVNSLFKTVGIYFPVHKKLIFSFLASSAVVITCITLLSSRTGLKLRAFGENQMLLERLGLSRESYRILGLGLSGAFAASYGVVQSQIYNFCDINMGFGTAITGIGSVVIGIQIVRSIPFLKTKLDNHSVVFELLSCFIGSFFYVAMTNLLLLLKVNPINFKMIFGLVIIFFLKLSRDKKHA